MAADSLNLDVHIIGIGGTQMAAKIDGTFTLDGTLKFPFEAIAFGRIGGQKHRGQAVRVDGVGPEGGRIRSGRGGNAAAKEPAAGGPDASRGAVA